MATLEDTYDKDQSVIGKMDDGMQKLMKAAKEAADADAGHKKMHTAWRAVHDVLHALYMKPNPKSEGSSPVTTSNKGAKTEQAANVDILPDAAAATTTAKAAATTTAKAPATATGGGHCDKKSKRRRRKGRTPTTATKKK